MAATLSESAVTISICRALKPTIRNTWWLNGRNYGLFSCPADVRRPTEFDA
jgi:hypothetical protein